MSAAAFRPHCAYARAAVVIPTHGEAAKLPGCLRAVITAALCAPIPVAIVVVLDDGDDNATKLAGRYGPDVHFIRVDARNVGTALAVGFDYARSLFADGDECWYATTDAGARVAPGWLVDQLELGADMVAGEAPGAGMGFSARAYRRVGGFRAGDRCGAGAGDVALVGRFEAAGYTVHRDTNHLGQLERSAAGDCA